MSDRDGTSGAALEIIDLTVTYGDGHRALSGVSFTVAADGSLGLVGASGSGKTTLLRAVMGLLPASARVDGGILVDGTDLVALSPRERRRLHGKAIGFVAQDPFAACDPLRRVRHHVAEAWEAHGEPVSDGAIDEGLAGIGIPDPAQRSRQRPHQWSGGMLQRATVLAATVHDPVVTLADEPTSALDADLADEALALLRSTCSALLLVTHDLALAGRHTHRLVVLDGGRVVEEGPSAELLTAPGHDTTRRLVEAATPPDRTAIATTARPAPDEAPSTSDTITPSRAVVVAAEGISRSYPVGGGRTVEAVRATSLEINGGEVLGVIGPSGSGKSTLLRLLAGMERPDTGTVRAGDHQIRGPSGPIRMPRPGFAMPIFQDPVASLDRRWPLWSTLTEPLVVAGGGRMGRRQRRDRAAEELALLGLDDIGVDRLPGSLSVGQCQRVAILRALIAGPALLVADEPTASLDVETAAAVGDLLRVAAERGTAVVVVSHDEPRLRSYADRILRMADGELRCDDRPGTEDG
jgi:peptide/nickel transport system ATP-binding protein